MTATVAFEQSYSTVDGDSASSSWLFAILSALSGVPVCQSVAVTGSVNQLGEIQPVGGITEKVEGYYRFCKGRGLSGDQGVVIPAQDVPHLMLRAEVRESIDAKEFHIWPILSVEQGIERLTGVSAGEWVAEEGYPEGTVMGLAAARLASLRAVAKEDA